VEQKFEDCASLKDNYSGYCISYQNPIETIGDKSWKVLAFYSPVQPPSDGETSEDIRWSRWALLGMNWGDRPLNFC